jgi:hypothetical protein
VNAAVPVEASVERWEVLPRCLNLTSVNIDQRHLVWEFRIDVLENELCPRMGGFWIKSIEANLCTHLHGVLGLKQLCQCQAKQEETNQTNGWEETMNHGAVPSFSFFAFRMSFRSISLKAIRAPHVHLYVREQSRHV